MVSPARVERATQRGLSSRRLLIAPWGRTLWCTARESNSEHPRFERGASAKLRQRCEKRRWRRVRESNPLGPARQAGAHPMSQRAKKRVSSCVPCTSAPHQRARPLRRFFGSSRRFNKPTGGGRRRDVLHRPSCTQTKKMMAGDTGLEPATSAVKVRCSSN